jgi:hypothetical protein
MESLVGYTVLHSHTRVGIKSPLSSMVLLELALLKPYTKETKFHSTMGSLAIPPFVVACHLLLYDCFRLCTR